MAIEQQARGPARALPAADRVDARALDWRQLGLEPQPAHAAGHELGQLPLTLGLRVALVADHRRQEVQARLLVEAGEHGVAVDHSHDLYSRGGGTASMSCRV